MLFTRKGERWTVQTMSCIWVSYAIIWVSAIEDMSGSGKQTLARTITIIVNDCGRRNFPSRNFNVTGSLAYYRRHLQKLYLQ